MIIIVLFRKDRRTDPLTSDASCLGPKRRGCGASLLGLVDVEN
jgi:hypothetical protein